MKNKVPYILTVIGSILSCLSYYLFFSLKFIGLAFVIEGIILSLFSAKGTKSILKAVSVHVLIFIAFYLLNLGFIYLIFVMHKN